MDAPEVVSGPHRSLSYMLRRQPKLEIPPPTHSPAGSGSAGAGDGSLYDFYLSKKGNDRARTSPVSPPKRRAWGRRKVVLCLALVVIVLVAAIGGGVGGSLAAADARRAASSNPTIVMMPQPTTITMMPTAAPSTAATPPPAPDVQGQGPLLAAAIKVPTEGVIDFECGRMSRDRQMITLGTATWGFDVHCMMDYVGPGVDIAGMTAYSFGDCIRSCAMFNKFARNNTCVGVFFSANLTTSLPRHGGNCFLKSYLPELSVHEDLAAAASLASSPQIM